MKKQINWCLIHLLVVVVQTKVIKKSIHEDGSKDFTIVKNIKHNTCTCACTCIPDDKRPPTDLEKHFAVDQKPGHEKTSVEDRSEDDRVMEEHSTTRTSLHYYQTNTEPDTTTTVNDYSTMEGNQGTTFLALQTTTKEDANRLNLIVGTSAKPSDFSEIATADQEKPTTDHTRIDHSLFAVSSDAKPVPALESSTQAEKTTMLIITPDGGLTTDEPMSSRADMVSVANETKTEPFIESTTADHIFEYTKTTEAVSRNATKSFPFSEATETSQPEGTELATLAVTATSIGHTSAEPQAESLSIENRSSKEKLNVTEPIDQEKHIYFVRIGKPVAHLSVEGKEVDDTRKHQTTPMPTTALPTLITFHAAAIKHNTNNADDEPESSDPSAVDLSIQPSLKTMKPLSHSSTSSTTPSLTTNHTTTTASRTETEPITTTKINLTTLTIPETTTPTTTTTASRTETEPITTTKIDLTTSTIPKTTTTTTITTSTATTTTTNSTTLLTAKSTSLTTTTTPLPTSTQKTPRSLDSFVTETDPTWTPTVKIVTVQTTTPASKLNSTTTIHFKKEQRGRHPVSGFSSFKLQTVDVGNDSQSFALELPNKPKPDTLFSMDMAPPEEEKPWHVERDEHLPSSALPIAQLRSTETTAATTTSYSWVSIIRQRIEAERMRLLNPAAQNKNEAREELEIRRQRVLAQQAAMREQKLEIERQMAETEARRIREEGERLEQARRLRLMQEHQQRRREENESVPMIEEQNNGTTLASTLSTDAIEVQTRSIYSNTTTATATASAANNSTATAPTTVTVTVNTARGLRYRLQSRQCQAIREFTRIYEITDAAAWVRQNCLFAKQYFPQASCTQIFELVAACF